MSIEATALGDAYDAYVIAHAASEDEYLRRLRLAAAEAGIPSISIGAAQAAFLAIVVSLSGARELIEVGTLAGYSAISMARALPAQGRLRTIELDRRHADFSERWIAGSDVADRVQVLRGAGCDVLRTLPPDSVDGIFIDADKGGYEAYLEEALRIVRRGGWIAVDNAFAFGQLFDAQPRDRDVPAVRAFNERMARDPRVRAVIVPLGDGCWLGVRVG